MIVGAIGERTTSWVVVVPIAQKVKVGTPRNMGANMSYKDPSEQRAGCASTNAQHVREATTSAV